MHTRHQQMSPTGSRNADSSTRSEDGRRLAIDGLNDAARGYLRLTGRSLRDCSVCGKGHTVHLEGALADDTPGHPTAGAT